MIADVESEKKIGSVVAELFSRGEKLNIVLVFVLQSYSKVPKTIRLNITHHFMMKIPNIKELQQIGSNHLSDIDFKNFMKIYKDYTKEPYSFLVNNTSLSSDNTLRFRKNLKMSFSEIKSINNKVEQNKTQYNLERRTAKISALSSGNFSK